MWLRLALRVLTRGDAASPHVLPAGVELRRSRWLTVLGGRLSGMGVPAAAVTLGNTIVIHPGIRLTRRLLRHELAHVAQWRRHPWTFPVRYALAHMRHGYIDNPFEAEARLAEAHGSDGTDD